MTREDEIRSEARTFLAQAWPAFLRDHGLSGEPPYDTETARAWQRRLAEAGWGAPSWPAEYGGKGFGPVENALWVEEKTRAGCNVVFNIVGFGMAGPTIISHGTDAQKDRYVAPLLQGDEIWCQLFSEPGAGSDLAGITTKAARDGDGWVVTGQKVWSSGAHDADFGILLARHDFDAPKHKGLVYFIVDMRAPGVEVRPLRQISGESHFSEVFLTDVRIADDHRIGEPGDGWGVAMTTLLHERMSIGSTMAGLTFPFEKLVQIARERGRLDTKNRHELVEIYTRERLLEWLNGRILGKLRAGQIPTAEGSILKLIIAGLSSRAANAGLEVTGAHGMIETGEGAQLQFLWAPGLRIGGGTDDVQRNVIAERVLGLPREPQPDRDIPFSEALAQRGTT